MTTTSLSTAMPVAPRSTRPRRDRRKFERSRLSSTASADHAHDPCSPQPGPRAVFRAFTACPASRVGPSAPRPRLQQHLAFLEPRPRKSNQLLHRHLRLPATQVARAQPAPVPNARRRPPISIQTWNTRRACGGSAPRRRGGGSLTFRNVPDGGQSLPGAMPPRRRSRCLNKASSRSCDGPVVAAQHTAPAPSPRPSRAVQPGCRASRSASTSPAAPASRSPGHQQMRPPWITGRGSSPHQHQRIPRQAREHHASASAESARSTRLRLAKRPVPGPNVAARFQRAAAGRRPPGCR